MDWLAAVAADLSSRFKAKFIAGQKEHGVDLGMVPTEMLVKEMEQEVLDHYAYIQELKRRQTMAEFQVAIHQGQLRLLVEAAGFYLTQSHLSRDIDRASLEQAITAAKSTLL